MDFFYEAKDDSNRNLVIYQAENHNQDSPGPFLGHGYFLFPLLRHRKM